MVVRISTKGQLIVPKSIRDRYGWRPGTELEVLDRGGEVVVRAATENEFPETTLDDLMGCAGYRGPAKTLEDMERGIARGAREVDDRS